MQSDILDLPANAPIQTNKIYGGFWPRVAALLLDTLILAPFTIVITYLNIASLSNYYYTSIASLSVLLIYNIYFVKQNGGTPGKRAMGLKIVKADGTDMDWQTAFLRYVVMFLVTSLSVVITALMIGGVDTDEYDSLTWLEKIKFLGDLGGWASTVSTVITNAWMLAGIIALVSNPKKRAVHDFIANTVVIKDIYEDHFRSTATA
jgi:uncharacterized RDD family membrane protein YckC